MEIKKRIKKVIYEFINDETNINNNIDEYLVEIEYNDDFSSEKTKSLANFPLKLLSNSDFSLDGAL